MPGVLCRLSACHEAWAWQFINSAPKRAYLDSIESVALWKSHLQHITCNTSTAPALAESQLAACGDTTYVAPNEFRVFSEAPRPLT